MKRRIGSYMMIIGVITAILPLIGYQSRIFGFFDNWGTSVGWAIKIGLIALGAFLYFGGMEEEQEPKAPE